MVLAPDGELEMLGNGSQWKISQKSFYDLTSHTDADLQHRHLFSQIHEHMPPPAFQLLHLE